METQTLDIPVLWPNYFEDCEQCVQRLQEMLEGMDGVYSVRIDTDRRTVTLTYDKDLVTFEEIRENALALGVTIAERYRHDVVHLVGLDCPDCAMKVETAIRKMRGVVWASLNYATSVLIVEYESQTIGLAAIQKRVMGFGYGIEEEVPGVPPSQRAGRSTRLTLTAISGVLLGAGLAVGAMGINHTISVILLLLSAITGGIYTARSGVLSIRSLTLDTNFLVTTAAVGAIALGDFSEAAAVMFLFSLGSTLEAYTVDRTRRSIKSLIEAFPTHASVKRNGRIEQLHLHDIEIGDIVLIKPGEKMPVDGTVVSGETSVDESPITGESILKDKQRGDTIYAGSINGRGSIEVRTTTTSDDNTLARIVHLVEEAQAQKAPSQRFSETFGRVYTPVVIGLAVLVAAGGPFLLGGDPRDWVARALTLLVVSCPCALVISTPVAIVAAIGNAAKSGVLIKGGAHLEMLGDVSVVAFDKTGTLTVGKPAVTDVVALNGRTKEDVLSYAAAAESRSEHPLADAIIDKSREMGLPERVVSFFEALPGKGARAVVNGEVIYIGSRRMLEEHSIPMPNSDELDELLAKGVTVVYVMDEEKLWGAIGASDTVRESSAPAIAKLRSAGIDRTVMLTGDTAQTGQAIATLLGIDEHHSELLPEDKLSKIRGLADGRGARVAMVGDGINDAPALAAADVGIAMGAAGTHAAIEAADVALMADDIVMLPYAVTLSRRAKRIIRQNVALALLVITILVSGALFKWVSLSTGVIGHEGSALLVIANSMRLLKRRG